MIRGLRFTSELPIVEDPAGDLQMKGDQPSVNTVKLVIGIHGTSPHCSTSVYVQIVLQLKS